MQVINKKIIVIFICLGIFIFGLFELFNKEKVVLDDVILDINNSKDSLAIYIEKYDEEGNASYVESKDNKFPIEDYVYNKELSGCLDNNSNEVENALNYNYINKELNLRVNKSVTCYVYYDYKGDGTEKVPYKIRSIEDLLDLSLSTNKGDNHTNEYFELTRDLDFQDKNSYNDSERTDYGNLNGIDDGNTLMNELTTGTGWVPIGITTSNKFEGNFNGNNKKITNLYEKRSYGGGLFLFINNATLKNLTLNGVVTADSGDVGGFVSTTYGNTLIDNCHNEVNVTSTSSGASTGGITGGSAGQNAVIKDSSNKGNINGSNNAGGLIGCYLYDLTIENSYNEGTITNSLGYHAGGLIGRDDKATNKLTILNSYNNGKVIIGGADRETFSGGLVGKLNGNAYINNSYNKGEINANIDASLTSVFSGGLIGVTLGKTIMTNSYNEGNITGGNRVGGLVGIGWSNSVTIIDKSYNLGDLTPSENSNWESTIFVGGITSYAGNGAQIYVFNSYNAGNMEANSLLRNGCAGLVTNINGNTDSQKASILNSYNIGNILNGNTGVGFSNLTSGALKLNNVYNMGDFKDVTTKYGIGQFYTGQKYSITNAYYRNKAEDGSDISGSNVTLENEIIGKDLNYMQSDAFITELNNNVDNITLSEYIDSTLLEEFKNKTGYELTLSKWTLKDGHPVLAF